MSALRLPTCWLLIGVAATIAMGCQQTQSLERSLTPPGEGETLDRDAPFLKAHLENGDVAVFSNWRVQNADQVILGSGHRLSPNRDTLAHGQLRIPLDRVALFETNTTEPSGSITALSILTGASLIVTAACLINPKACFGSCPTFYAPAGSDTLLQAEGFSSSIAPSLERTDVDALYRASASESTVDLRMTNEALETHVVRKANVLMVPRAENERAFQATDGSFWTADTLQRPSTCTAPEGTCRALVEDFDGEERFSRADSTDLATQERITLEFDAPPSDSLGLVIGTRQTLMTTFLLYQTLAYMGTDVGEWLAMLERNNASVRNAKVKDMLGRVEVWAPAANGRWTKVGEAGEHGPIATDVHLVPLSDLPTDASTLQLRLTKGNWRIDYLALAHLSGRADPIRVPPSSVSRDGTADPEALAQLRDATQTLTTMPGDAYTLSYDLPTDATGHELFLESRGYYLEWMREDWLEETNPDRVADMLFEPEQMMKTLAPAFKAVEPHMEDAFWNSRYER